MASEGSDDSYIGAVVTFLKPVAFMLTPATIRVNVAITTKEVHVRINLTGCRIGSGMTVFFMPASNRHH